MSLSIKIYLLIIINAVIASFSTYNLCTILFDDVPEKDKPAASWNKIYCDIKQIFSDEFKDEYEKDEEIN